MKKGDKVTIRDNSWTKSAISGKLIHEILVYGDEKGKKYVIVETGCSFPAEKRQAQDCGSGSSFNNTVIQAIDSGKVVFIEERFLELVPLKHKIMTDVELDHGCFLFGNVVEISDRLYKEIKRVTQN